MRQNATTFWFGVISLIPDAFQTLTDYGVTGRAITRRQVELQYWNPRDFSDNNQQQVDDKPFGGGPGMLLMAPPLRAAIAAARKAAPANTKVIYLTPQGRPFTQATAEHISQEGSLILLCGRYEGVDERVLQRDVDEEWSIGDYVLTGGELPAMVIMDAIIRLLDGAVGDADSVRQDTFSDGLLDHPHFTRPQVVGSLAVPNVLLSGDHGAIARWRLQQSLGRTFERRPDLLQKKQLSEIEQTLIKQYLAAKSSKSPPTDQTEEQ